MIPIKINPNPSVPPLPRIQDKTKINIRYTVISPYVSVHIYWNKKYGELMYEVEEPRLDDVEKANLQNIEESLKELVDVEIVVKKDPQAIIEYIDSSARGLIE